MKDDHNCGIIGPHERDEYCPPERKQMKTEDILPHLMRMKDDTMNMESLIITAISAGKRNDDLHWNLTQMERLMDKLNDSFKEITNGS